MAKLESIFIPFNDPVTNICDYVLQTGLELTRQNKDVYLGLFHHQNWFLANFFRSKNEIKKEISFLPKENIFIPYSLFPNGVSMPYRLLKFNQIFINWQTDCYMKRNSIDAIWCFDPIDHNLVKRNSKILSIYDCVDFFSSIDKPTNEVLKHQESELINNSDYFFVNSKILKKLHKNVRQAHVVNQGFDILSFKSKSNLDNSLVRELRVLRAKSKRFPLIGYVGNLNFRLDFEFLYRLIAKNRNCFFVFTDLVQKTETEDGGRNTILNIRKLRRLPNVFFAKSSKNKQYVKQLISLFKICLIPYDLKYDHNKFSYPMKLYEYFFQGKPVLSTPIEELKDKKFSNLLYLSSDSDESQQIIQDLLCSQWPRNKRKEQIRLAVKNSWKVKIESILKHINTQHQK